MKNPNYSFVFKVIISIFALILSSNIFAAIKSQDLAQPTAYTGITGAEQCSVYHAGKLTCYDSKKYYIIERSLAQSVGNDILIKFKKTGGKTPEKFSCNYVVGAKDYEIKNEFAEYFFGVLDELLFLDSGTGPGPRGLIVYDLKQKKVVYRDFYSDPITIFKNKNKRTLSFWKETGKANEKNCPEYKKIIATGLDAAIESRVLLDLNSFKITKTKEVRCASRQ